MSLHGSTKLTALNDAASSTYVYHTGPGAGEKVDTFGFDVGVQHAASVQEVRLTLTAKLAAITHAALRAQTVARVGGVLYYGAQVSGAPNNIVTATQTWYTNPASGLPWTRQMLEATEFGVALYAVVLSFEGDNILFTHFATELSLEIDYTPPHMGLPLAVRGFPKP